MKDLFEEMLMNPIQFTNDYHRTAITVRPDLDGYLTPRQVRRIRRALCSDPSCTCSDNPLGVRGQPRLIFTCGKEGGAIVLIR